MDVLGDPLHLEVDFICTEADRLHHDWNSVFLFCK